MASSVRGQHEPNPTLWLAARAGKMELSCPLGTTRCVPQENFSYYKSLLNFITQYWNKRICPSNLPSSARLDGQKQSFLFSWDSKWPPRDKGLLMKLIGQDIYLIHQARGLYWENIGPRSWQYGPSAARSVQKRPRADILPGRSRASLVNKRFITRLKLFRRKTQMIDCKDTINFKRENFYLKQTERLLTSDVFKKKKNKVGRKQK